ncbi:MAG: GntR family transcriptional regulator [Lautropia sp.]
MDLAVTPTPALIRRQIEDRLRTAILDGRFQPGDRLIERDLCERLNVSRTSLREALRQLESEGLIVLVPFRGPVVAGLTLEDARHIYQVREMLEGFACGAFATLASDDQRARLEDAYAEYVTAVGDGRLDALLDIKERFYAVLLEGCGNPIVRDMFRQINNRVRWLRGTSLSAPARPAVTRTELRKVLDAIAVRDGALARATGEEHVRSAAKVALALMARRDSPNHRESG